MSRRRVEDLAEFYYGPEGEPRFHTDRMLEVGVAKNDCDTDRPSGLQIVSPEEVLHATFCGCAKAIKLLGYCLKVSFLQTFFPFECIILFACHCFIVSLRLKGILSDEDFKKKMDKWRAVLLSIPCTFSEMTLSEMWKHAFNRRQAVLQEHESLSRTGLQSAMEVFHLKSLVENTTGSTKLSAQALSAELVKLGLQQVIGGSKMEEDEADNGSLTPGFISQALKKISLEWGVQTEWGVQMLSAQMVVL